MGKSDKKQINPSKSAKEFLSEREKMHLGQGVGGREY